MAEEREQKTRHIYTHAEATPPRKLCATTSGGFRARRQCVYTTMTTTTPRKPRATTHRNTQHTQKTTHTNQHTTYTLEQRTPCLLNCKRWRTLRCFSTKRVRARDTEEAAPLEHYYTPTAAIITTPHHAANGRYDDDDDVVDDGIIVSMRRGGGLTDCPHSAFPCALYNTLLIYV